ncbi:MAG: hypothetical protein AB8B66_00735 [Rickettsiaceae bacterium]
MQAVKLLYKYMGHDIDFINTSKAAKTEESKENDTLTLDLDADRAKNNTYKQLEEEIHTANIDILMTQIYAFIAKASSIDNYAGKESINLIKNLRNNHVLPKILVTSLDKALKSYKEYTSNPVSVLTDQILMQTIMSLKTKSTQQKLQLEQQEQRISKVESLLAQMLDQNQNPIHIADDVVNIVGDDPDSLLQSIE